jgi:hypothetical protein
VKEKLTEQTFFVLVFTLILPLSFYRFEFNNPISRNTFKVDFLSGAASQENLSYAWNSPRCYIAPPGIQFPFSVAQFKVVGFTPISGANWFERLSLVSNLDLTERYMSDRRYRTAEMTEVQSALNNGFRTLTKNDIRKVISATNCKYFFLPKDFLHLSNKWNLTVIDDAPEGFYVWLGKSEKDSNSQD